MTESVPPLGNVDSLSSELGEHPYKVGRCRPPKETRFKPGQSGNPSGRPKGSRNWKTKLREIYGMMVPVREGTKRQHRTLLELVVLTQCQRALKGDERAAQAAVRTARMLGVFDDERDFEWTQEDFAGMSDQTFAELEKAYEARARRLGIGYP